MTVVLVCLLQGLSKDEYIGRLKRESQAGTEAALDNMMDGMRNLYHVDEDRAIFYEEMDVKKTAGGSNIVTMATLLGYSKQSGDNAKSKEDKFATPTESPNQKSEECRCCLFEN
jgi:hypothetical protein